MLDFGGYSLRTYKVESHKDINISCSGAIVVLMVRRHFCLQEQALTRWPMRNPAVLFSMNSFEGAVSQDKSGESHIEMLHREGRINGEVHISVIKPSGVLKYLPGFWGQGECSETEIMC